MEPLRERVIAEIDSVMDNVRSDCRTNRCVAADRIIALCMQAVDKDREYLRKVAAEANAEYKKAEAREALTHADRDSWKASAEVAEQNLAATKVREAALVAALHKIAYEPIGDAEASHREVLDATTEIARAVLATTPVATDVRITMYDPPAEGFSGGHDEPATPRDAAKEQTP